MTVTYRAARADDADPIARLHAESWRRHYRGAFSDAFLDGDVVTDRLAVWTDRLAPAGAPSTGGLTVVAECRGDLAGFIHVIFDLDPRWGSLIDNLHVGPDHRRAGIGRTLISHAAAAAPGAMYLWVLEQNLDAQRFYRTCGGTPVEVAIVDPPGGVPSRLNGRPNKLRYAWPAAGPASPPASPAAD